jgi:hypothetical protein
MSRYGSRLHVSAGCAWALALWQEVAGSSRPPFARTSPRWERTRVQLSEFSVRFRHLPTLRFSTLPIRLSFRFTFRSSIHSHRRLSHFSGREPDPGEMPHGPNRPAPSIGYQPNQGSLFKQQQERAVCDLAALVRHKEAGACDLLVLEQNDASSFGR